MLLCPLFGPFVLELDATIQSLWHFIMANLLFLCSSISDHLVPARKNAYYAIDRFLLPGAQHKHEGLRSIFGFPKSSIASCRYSLYISMLVFSPFRQLLLVQPKANLFLL